MPLSATPLTGFPASYTDSVSGTALSLCQDLSGFCIETPPPDPELPRRRAEVTLWSGDVSGALKHFTELVQADRDNARLWPGFVESLSTVEY